jgi:spore coat polysaccharide biosynthesis predicted glycosyltransferase SpsG
MDVCFLVSDSESCRLLRELSNTRKQSDRHPSACPDTDEHLPDSITIIQLKTAQYDNLEKELPEVISLLTSARQISASYPDTKQIVYLTDSYFVTEKYLSSLSAFLKTAYMDDLRAFDYPVNLIINYDLIPSAELPAYQNAYRKAEHLLLGASYTPLRSQFLHRQITVKEQLTDILVTTGGSDPFHFCLGFLAHLNRRLKCNAGHCQTSGISKVTHSRSDAQKSIPVSSVTFHIVIGKLNTDREKLWQIAGSLPCLRLHENVSDMASLMGKCDMAVSAAGTTLYELCALGVPSISFTMADNQLTAAKAFDNSGTIPCAGDIRTDKEYVLQTVFHFMENCSIQKRKAASDAMHRLVDGKGSLRIASALKEL